MRMGPAGLRRVRAGGGSGRPGIARRAHLLHVLAAAGAVGCGGDLTSGGFGEVEVFAVADSSAASVSTAGGGAALQGALTVRLRVDLQGGDGEWVELTDGEQELVLPLAGGDPVPVARRELPPGRYDRVRTRLSLVRAEVEGGLELGGEPWVGSAIVLLPQGGGAFERSSEIEVRERAVVGLVLELRAGRWLRALDREEGTVPREAFEESPEVRGR